MSTHESVYASGDWQVRAGSEEEFTKRWDEFLTWTRDHVEGFEEATLVRDTAEPSHFLSLSRWSSSEAREHWKAQPDFAERFSACRALCDDFTGTDYASVLTI